MVNKKQMVAGILMTIGIFSIGFAFGYNWCFQEYNTTTENITYSININQLEVDHFTDVMVSLKNNTNNESIIFNNTEW